MTKLTRFLVRLIILSAVLMLMVGCPNSDSDAGASGGGGGGGTPIVNTEFTQSVAGRKITLQAETAPRNLQARAGTSPAYFSLDGETLFVGGTQYTFDDANSSAERGIYVNGSTHYVLLRSSGTVLLQVAPKDKATFPGMPDKATLKIAKKNEAKITGFTPDALAATEPPSTLFLNAVSGQKFELEVQGTSVVAIFSQNGRVLKPNISDRDLYFIEDASTLTKGADDKYTYKIVYRDIHEGIPYYYGVLIKDATVSGTNVTGNIFYVKTPDPTKPEEGYTSPGEINWNGILPATLKVNTTTGVKEDFLTKTNGKFTVIVDLTYYGNVLAGGRVVQLNKKNISSPGYLTSLYDIAFVEDRSVYVEKNPSNGPDKAGDYKAIYTDSYRYYSILCRDNVYYLIDAKLNGIDVNEIKNIDWSEKKALNRKTWTEPIDN